MRFEVDANGCWNFTGPLNVGGYGKVKFKNKDFTAHRMMAHICIKPIMSETDIVAHRCDNPRCINPEHLFITTPLGNMMDRDAKGRGARGVKSPFAKLSESDVSCIRDLYAKGSTLSQIAPGYGVTPGCIQAIVKRRTWKHLP